MLALVLVILLTATLGVILYFLFERLLLRAYHKYSDRRFERRTGFKLPVRQQTRR